MKPENILLTRDCVVKLCDFGFARSLVAGQQLTDYVATRWYRAPELLVGDTNYSQPVDVWAIGCVIAELIRGEPLWPGKSDVDQLHLIRCTLGQLSARHLAVFRSNQYFAGVSLPELPGGQSSGLRAKLPAPVDEAALDLLRQSLHKEPAARPTAEAMLRHPYFDRLSLPEALEREHRLSGQQLQLSAAKSKQLKVRARSTIAVRSARFARTSGR